MPKIRVSTEAGQLHCAARGVRPASQRSLSYVRAVELAQAMPNPRDNAVSVESVPAPQKILTAYDGGEAGRQSEPLERRAAIKAADDLRDGSSEAARGRVFLQGNQ